MAARWALLALSLALLATAGCEKQRRPRDGAPPALYDGDSCGLSSQGSSVGPAVFTGVTSGPSLAAGSCRSQTDEASESLHEWIAPTSGSYTINTDGSSFDTVLYVLDGTCGGRELGCDDDTGSGTASLVNLISVYSGQRLTIVVDGYSSTSAGSYVVNISGGGL